MNLVQFKRHDGDGDVFINPAHVAMVEPSTVGDARLERLGVPLKETCTKCARRCNDAVQCFQVFAPKIDHRAGAPSPEKTTETDSRNRTLGEAVFTRKNAGLDPLP